MLVCHLGHVVAVDRLSQHESLCRLQGVCVPDLERGIHGAGREHARIPGIPLNSLHAVLVNMTIGPSLL